MSAGIYKIIGPNNKIYIGSSVNIRKRWAEHLRGLNNNKHPNSRIQNAWNLHGADSFKFEVIELCDRIDLLLREQSWLDNLLPFYNIARDAAAPMRGRKTTEETKEKQRQASLGIKKSPEHAKKLKDRLKTYSDARKGTKISDENRLKLKVPKKKRTEQHRKNLSEAGKGRKPSDETLEKLKVARKNRTSGNLSNKELQRRHKQKKAFLEELKLKFYSWRQEKEVQL